MAATRIDLTTAVPRRRAGRLPPSLALAVLLPGLAPARAAPPPPPIDRHHVSWTARDGAPAMVLSMTQTRDGWLWLGGPGGLFRFDGARFERYAEADAALPSNNVSVVSAQAAGALWIGYRFGGVSVLAQGRLRSYDERDGLPRNTAVWSLEADGGGRMWAATSLGLYYLDGARWRAAAVDWGLGDCRYQTLMRDRHGVLWVQGEDGVHTLAAGAARFVKTPADSGLGVLLEVPDGSVWSWDARRNHLHRLTAPARGAAPRAWGVHGNLGTLLFDRGGELWTGDQAGVAYHTARGMTQTGPQQGLSGAAVSALFEDREGNIWAATVGGVDRFRRQRVARVAAPENAGSRTLAADGEGGVWSGRFHLARPGQGAPVATALWPPSPAFGHDWVSCSYRDADGVLWSGSDGGLWRTQGGRTSRVALPPGIAGGQFNGMARDRDGGLWASLAARGVYRRGPDGAWEKKDGRDGLPDEPARVMASADRAGLWLGYPRGRLLQWDGARWRSYGAAQGVRLGMVMALHLHGAHVWAGGENGLALRQGASFTGVGGADGQAFEGLTGIVELDNGDLWLNGVSGLFRIAAAEVARLENTPAYRVRYERLDGVDGLDSTAPLLLPTPSLALAADGQLWVATTTGLFRFDPARRPPAGPAPLALIRRIGAPGQAHPALPGMRLAPGTATLRIDYTAITLAMPERLRFRYRLDGVDAHWQEAGRGRAAYYNNLGAGDYHFRVQASNTDGAWDGQASALDFSIAPTATQTWWFKGVCALALLAAGWLAYRLRMRQLTAQVAGRLEERLNERERIARELHDTLLQSVQGLILHVHAAAMRLPAPEPARGLIEEALLRADDVLHEGRDRVRALRHGDAGAQELAAALADASAQLQPPGAAPLCLQVTGAPRRLHPVIQQETLAIACEAIANAYRHAGATAIEARLDYRAGQLRLSIRDDGAGVPPEVLAAGGRHGHWGFSGMRERAGRIQARLTLHSTTGGGTEWRLALAGALAYQVRPPPRCPP